MKTISQDKPFTSDTLKGANNKLYALTNAREQTDEDGNTQHLADGILIDNISQAGEAIKQYKLDTIVSDNNFYADSISRVDLLTVLILKLIEDLDDTTELEVPGWKKADGVVSTITVGDVKSAVQDSLSQKGSVIGVS